MSVSLNSLGDLARQIELDEAERSRLSYDDFCSNIHELINSNSPKVVRSIKKPEATKDGTFLYLKEPLEYLALFKDISDSQLKCQALLTQLIAKRDVRLVENAIPAMPNDLDIWFNSSAEGINLRPGLENGEFASPTAITLGDDCVHGLVGGRTGSGKSVFLNSLLFSAMTEYAPWELSIFLIDFKKVELSRYLTRSRAPHVKAVGATSEVRYVISLLDYLNRCMKARQDLFAMLGVQKIKDFRERFGVTLPRVLLVVDEFQQMFLESTSREQTIIADTLTSITKLGRATGFHLLFASQEMRGTLNGAIFGNFKARFALACDKDISADLIGNTAASTLAGPGTVIANCTQREEDNRIYRVPFISEEYFYRFLQTQAEIASKYNFSSVHKLYQEEHMEDIAELENVLQRIKGARKQAMDDDAVLDVLTLGRSVVFNFREYDYETVFLKQGARKNIGVFCPDVYDGAYLCKLLSTNLKTSPNIRYRHTALVRNDLLFSKSNLKYDLELSDEQVHASNDIIDEFISVFNKRSSERELLQHYRRFESLEAFAKEALNLRAEYIFGSDMTDVVKRQLDDIFFQIASLFSNATPDDIPRILDDAHEKFEVDDSYFRILRMLYDKEVLGKRYSEIFDPLVLWILGADLMGDYARYRDLSRMLNESNIYNILAIIIATSDFDHFSDLFQSCNYIFITGNEEKIYTRLRIPYTNKTPNSITVDFGIRSDDTQRSFKKFRCDLGKEVVPELNFDMLLSE